VEFSEVIRDVFRGHGRTLGQTVRLAVPLEGFCQPPWEMVDVGSDLLLGCPRQACRSNMRSPSSTPDHPHLRHPLISDEVWEVSGRAAAYCELRAFWVLPLLTDLVTTAGTAAREQRDI